MIDKRKNNGGHSTKPTNPNDKRLLTKSEEEKSNVILLKAIGEFFNKENDTESKIEFAKDLLTFERGKMFIAEHIFGKPKETIDQNVSINDFSLKDVIKFKE